AECGGSLSCPTCHAFLDEADADKGPETSEMEDEMLYGTTEDREDNSRLSCQLKLRADSEVHVTTPETQVEVMTTAATGQQTVPSYAGAQAAAAGQATRLLIIAPAQSGVQSAISLRARGFDDHITLL